MSQFDWTETDRLLAKIDRNIRIIWGLVIVYAIVVALYAAEVFLGWKIV